MRFDSSPHVAGGHTDLGRSEEWRLYEHFCNGTTDGGRPSLQERAVRQDVGQGDDIVTGASLVPKRWQLGEWFNEGED